VQTHDHNESRSILPPPPPPSPKRKDEKSDRISAERNLEKWPAIWQPARAHTKLEARHLERELELADGRRVTAKVKIGFTDEGMLTTEDQKTYYALVKHWYESESPDSHIPFSVRKLAKILQKKGWGTNVIESITDSLSRLRVTPFTWTNSYTDASTGEVIEEIDKFNLLSDLKIVRRKTDGHITYEAGYYRFNDFITKNLLANHTKPVLFDVILQFKSDIAQLVYTHVDLMLYGKSQYERRTGELFDDLGLKGAAYKNASNRKQKLIPALKELQGVRITSGLISEALIERTKDGKDYKVVFRKSAAPHEVSAAPSQDTVIESHTPSQKEPIAPQAEELVCYFHKLFHGVEKHIPQSKELSQAVSLIATLGLEKARYVIDFSWRAAEETKYKPITFGGILQYTSKAAARFDEARAAKERALRFQKEQAEINRLEEAYDAFVTTAINAYMADPAKEAEIAAITTEQVRVARQKYPFMTPVQQEDVAKTMTRAELRRRLGMISKDEFFARGREAVLRTAGEIVSSEAVQNDAVTESPDERVTSKTASEQQIDPENIQPS
jgi:hypothetical protein